MSEGAGMDMAGMPDSVVELMVTEDEPSSSCDGASDKGEEVEAELTIALPEPTKSPARSPVTKPKRRQPAAHHAHSLLPEDADESSSKTSLNRLNVGIEIARVSRWSTHTTRSVLSKRVCSYRLFGLITGFNTFHSWTRQPSKHKTFA